MEVDEREASTSVASQALESTPLLQPPRQASIAPTSSPLDLHALASLLLQHASSTWQARSFEFSSFLFLATLFPNSLLPASLFTFSTTGVAICFGGFIGNLVDKTPRLKFVRSCIMLQKANQGIAYSLFLVLFLKLRAQSEIALHTSQPLVWFIFGLIVATGCALNLSTIAIQVGVERDWVTCIAERDSVKLTTLNTFVNALPVHLLSSPGPPKLFSADNRYLRRIDLLSKLLAPLFVSLLTVTVSYPFCVIFLLALSEGTLVFEFVWIEVVYRRLPMLAIQETERRAEEGDPAPAPVKLSLVERLAQFHTNLTPTIRQHSSDWYAFATSSIFPSSLSISLLYLTVLSFDGTLITYLKSHAFSDGFVAGMRGICVVTGLLGTMGMPFLEKRIGVTRTGLWSLTSQLLSLIPVLLSFFIGAAADGERGPAWNSALLFSGLALSRIGLWAFDLSQLKELQTALEDHPRKNSITSLQYSLQNVFDLFKSILTIFLSRPSQFKWCALVSYLSAVLGGFSYLYYVKKDRGHIFHLEWLRKRD